MKLYLITTKLGTFYVISTDPTQAEIKLTDMLHKADYGFTVDRKITRIDVLATEIGEFPKGKPNFCGGDNLIL